MRNRRAGRSSGRAIHKMPVWGRGHVAGAVDKQSNGRRTRRNDAISSGALSRWGLTCDIHARSGCPPCCDQGGGRACSSSVSDKPRVGPGEGRGQEQAGHTDTRCSGVLLMAISLVRTRSIN